MKFGMQEMLVTPLLLMSWQNLSLYELFTETLMDKKYERFVQKNQRFKCEEVDVWITHIGGYPNRYSSDIRELIKKKPPKLFISGHSHILKVMYDKKLNLLHMNPGAAGKYGVHKLITMLRFSIDGK